MAYDPNMVQASFGGIASSAEYNKLIENIRVINLRGRGLVGGRTISGTAAIGSAINTTETMPTYMNSGDTGIQLYANREYLVRVRAKAVYSANNTQAIWRIRAGATAGTSGALIREFVHTNLVGTIGMTEELTGKFRSAIDQTMIFSFTCARLNGSGTIQFYAGGAVETNLVGVTVEDIGPSGLLTSTSV